MKGSLMRCADARLDLSARLDDELARERQAALEEHVAGCAACASYGATLHRVRTGLRVEPVVRVVDLAPRLLVALEGEPAPAPAPKPSVAPRVSIAAAFVAAAVAGATFVGFWSGPEPVAARDLSQEVLRAQARVDTLRAGLTIERDVGASADRQPRTGRRAEAADQTPVGKRRAHCRVVEPR